MFLPFAGALGAAQPGSVDFNRASSQSIETTGNVAAIGTGDFTIEARVKLDSTGAEFAVGGVGGSGSGGALMVVSAGAGMRLFFNGTGVFNAGPLSAGTVHDLAFSRSGSTLRAFVDGALTSFTSNSASVSSGKGLMAQKDTTGGSEFDGLIGFLHVTARAKYTSAYTPATIIEPDDDTLFLIHNPTGIAIEEANDLALTLNNTPTANAEFLT